MHANGNGSGSTSPLPGPSAQPSSPENGSSAVSGNVVNLTVKLDRMALMAIAVYCRMAGVPFAKPTAGRAVRDAMKIEAEVARAEYEGRDPIQALYPEGTTTPQGGPPA